MAAGIAPEALTKIVGHASYTTSMDKYADDLKLEYLLEEAQKKM